MKKSFIIVVEIPITRRMRMQSRKEISKQLRATGSRYGITENDEFYLLIKELLLLREVQALKEFTHHRVATRFQHSLNVSYYLYLLCRFCRLDSKSAARAGLLHDLYFYETNHYSKHENHMGHCQYHPTAALKNALKVTAINPKEEDMITKHMWPMTSRRPKYAETYLLTFVDKYCAIMEFLLLQPIWKRIKMKLVRGKS